jgi:hypothetical protein
MNQDNGQTLLLAKKSEFQERDQVWLHRKTWPMGESPKLQPLWEGPHKVVTWINVVLYRIQCHPRMKMTVVHRTNWGHVQGYSG